LESDQAPGYDFSVPAAFLMFPIPIYVYIVSSLHSFSLPLWFYGAG